MTNNTPLLTPRRPDQADEGDPAKNPSQAYVDREFNDIVKHYDNNNTAEQTGDELADQEAAAADTAAETAQTAQGGDTKSQETEPARPWATNVTGGEGTPSSTLASLRSRSRGMSPLKKRIIISIIIGFVLFGASAGAVVYAGIFALKEMITSKVTKERTKHKQRQHKQTNKNKLKEGQNNTPCTGGKAKCAFTSFSEREMKAMKDAGLNPNGQKMPDGRYAVSSIESLDDNNNKIKIDANNFDDASKGSIRMNSALNTVNNPRGYANQGVSATKVYTKAGVPRGGIQSKNVSDPNDPDAKRNVAYDQDELKKAFRQLQYGQATSAQLGLSQDANSAERDGTDVDNQNAQSLSDNLDGIDDEIVREAEIQRQLAADGRPITVRPDTSNFDLDLDKVTPRISGALGSPLKLIDKACTINSLIRKKDNIAKIFGALQLIKYAVLIMVLVDQMKAGDGTYGIVFFLMGMFMKQSVEPESKGKTAFNSALIDMAFNRQPDKAGLARFTLGAPKTKVTDKIKDVLEGFGATPSNCKKVKSWWGQLTLNIVDIASTVLSGGATRIIGGLVASVAGNILVAYVAQYLTPILVQFIAGTFTPDFDDPGGGFAFGNAIYVGMAAMGFNAMGRSEGLKPQTKKDYAKAAFKGDEEYKRILAAERYGKNPFDAGLEGSITGQLAVMAMPYFVAPLSSGTLQSVASIATNPFGLLTANAGDMLMGKAKAATPDPEGYFGDQCGDEDFQKLELQTDAACNPVHQALEFDDWPTVYKYMVTDNGYADEDFNPKKDEYKEFVEICLEGNTPYTSQGNNGQDDDTKRCVTEETDGNYFRDNMFRQFYSYKNELETEAKHDAGTLGLAGTGGASTAGGSALSPEVCKNGTVIPPEDPINAVCLAYQYDEYGYKWGGGHGDWPQAKDFLAKFRSGGFAKGTIILDCSGLIRMLFYEAFGEDVNGVVETQVNNSKWFQKISAAEAKPGDVFATGNFDHTGIIVENYPDKQSYKIFHASSPNVEKSKQIREDANRPWDPNVYRYIGPKNGRQ